MISDPLPIHFPALFEPDEFRQKLQIDIKSTKEILPPLPV